MANIQESIKYREYYINSKEKLQRLLATCNHITVENKTEEQACLEENINLEEFNDIIQKLGHVDFKIPDEILVPEAQWKNWQDKLLSDLFKKDCIAPEGFILVAIRILEIDIEDSIISKYSILHQDKDSEKIKQLNEYKLGLQAMEYYYNYGYSCKKIGQILKLDPENVLQIISKTYNILDTSVYKTCLLYGIKYMEKFLKYTSLKQEYQIQKTQENMCNE